jgi:hypothetical protein
MFLPVGPTCQAGVKLTIDQGGRLSLVPYQYLHRSRSRRNPACLGRWRAGKKLLLEFVNSSVMTASTSLPLDQFATVRHGNPARTFEQAIDE